MTAARANMSRDHNTQSTTTIYSPLERRSMQWHALECWTIADRPFGNHPYFGQRDCPESDESDGELVDDGTPGGC
jgi:hypothetical protein